MKKVLLIGGRGYIGSRYFNDFKDEQDIEVVDIGWFSKDGVRGTDFNDLEESHISKFDSIILLAGHSSVKMCDEDRKSSFNNNVRNFVNILEKVREDQRLIYASSSSVYGDTKSSSVDEQYNTYEPNNYYDLTKQISDIYAQKSNLDIYGLRFGTVNGWSPVLRADIMINAMVRSALQDGHVKLYVKDIYRPILGISDLCSAIKILVESKERNPGIYNLASFNSTSEEIANQVAEEMGVEVVEYSQEQINTISNIKLQSKAYNFSIDSSKFCRTYGFGFKETVESITKEVRKGLEEGNCEITFRTEGMKYE